MSDDGARRGPRLIAAADKLRVLKQAARGGPKDMMQLALYALLVLVAAARASGPAGSLYDVFPEGPRQHAALQELGARLPGLDFWQRAHPAGREARVLVPAALEAAFLRGLREYGLHYEVALEDVDRLLLEESAANEVARQRAARAGGESRITFTAYHRVAEINSYLDGLAAKFPGRVKVLELGSSGQGRAMKAVRISTDGGGNSSKPLAVVDAGIHAREWIAPAQALYMIHKLVEDVTESDVVSGMDWIIVPVLNPDGYEYSHTTSRLWRKTRSTVSSTSCPGVDGNRNFDYKWMVSGSSSSPCSDIFAGPNAFSEPETRHLRDLVLGQRARVKLYLAVHSYGSYFLYPYGYDGSDPSNAAELGAVGRRVAAAIDAAAGPGSKRYLVGNSAVALNYAASGASDDWARGAAGVALSYTLELPGGGLAGFDLPPARIAPVVAETWQGLLVLARYAIGGQ